jgi:sugar phosphate isomerase/epimerase
MMRLGISSYTYTWVIGVPGKEPDYRMNIFGLFEKALQHKVGVLQVADNLPLHVLSREESQALLNLSREHQVGIEVGSRGIQPENFLRYLDIAEYYQSPILRMVIDARGFTPSLPDIHSIIADFLPELKRRKILLAIENHDRLKASEFASIVEKAGSEWVGICLDTVNSMGAGEGIEEVSRILAPYTVNFHIKDFMVSRIWHMMGFTIEGKPAGQGMLPIKQVLDKLEKWGRCQSGILELWTPQQTTIEDTIKLEEQWTAESIQYLKTIIKE